MAVLRLDRVSRRFGGVQAVKDLSMTVRPGRITGLIGPNGAGKTTVVNLIAGLLKLAAGRISLDDRDIHELPPHEIARLRHCADIPEHAAAQGSQCARQYPRRLPAGGRGAVLSPRRLGLPAMRRARGASIARAHALLMETWHERIRQPSRRRTFLRSPAPRRDHARAGAGARGASARRACRRHERHRGATNLARFSASSQQRGIAILLIEHNMRFVMSLVRRNLRGRDRRADRPWRARDGARQSAGDRSLSRRRGMLEVRDLTSSYGGIVAVRDASLRVARRSMRGADRLQRRRQDHAAAHASAALMRPASGDITVPRRGHHRTTGLPGGAQGHAAGAGRPPDPGAAIGTRKSRAWAPRARRAPGGRRTPTWKRCLICFRAWRNGWSSWPARFRAVSSRCWRSGAP